MVPIIQVQKLCANSKLILNIRLVCTNWNLDNDNPKSTLQRYKLEKAHMVIVLVSTAHVQNNPTEMGTI